MIKKRGGGGGGRGKWEECQKNVLVMKCNKNVNMPCRGKYYQ